MTTAIPTAFNPPTLPSAPSLPIPPCPADMPQQWDSIRLGSVLGTLQLGPAYGDEATITVELDSSVKVDKQKSAGKSKSKTKVNGKDDIKGKLIVKWTSASWEAGCRFTMQIDPQGPTGGTPMSVDHPEFQRRTGSPTLGQTASAPPPKIIITKAHKMALQPGGTMYSQEFDFEEWVAPSDAPGTTDTPQSAQSYNVSTTKIGSNGNTVTGFGDTPTTTAIGSNGNTVTGFSGPSAPTATP